MHASSFDGSINVAVSRDRVFLFCVGIEDMDCQHPGPQGFNAGLAAVSASISAMSWNRSAVASDIGSGAGDFMVDLQKDLDMAAQFEAHRRKQALRESVLLA